MSVTILMTVPMIVFFLPVLFAIDRAGLVGADGATHAGSFDNAYLGCLPNFVIMAASDEAEMVHMVATQVAINDRPSALRYPRCEGRGVEMPEVGVALPIGKGRIIREGKKVAILSLGTRLAEALKAADILEGRGLSATVADLRFAKPLDEALLAQLAKNHEVLITIEEGAVGGFGAFVLHSLSGTMAISETTLKDTILFLIDEQNKKGGLLGKKLEAVVVDPASNWPLFAEKARELITKEKVAAVFGCWTSVSRKSVLPVFKELNNILFYPVQYEGEESERNVFYTGAAPNQQAIPAVDYLMSKDGGAAKRWVLLGTDYVYPRTTNKILRAYLKSKGVDPMRLPMPAQISPNDTFFDKAGKVLGNAALTVAGTGFGMLPGDSPASFAAGKKTEIKTEKPPAAAQNTPVPASTAPSETSAPQAPASSRLRGVMDGVNMAALMTPRGFTGEFGKMLANRGTNTAALANNRQQMAEQQLEWDRQKFGLQRDWDMRRYGIDKTTDMAAKNRELGYKMIEDRFRIKDDPKSEEQVALAKAQMDAGMLDPRVGGWHAASADTISEGVRLLGADAKAANERTGLVMGPIRNTLYGDYNRARTPWDLMPQGATVPGVISNSVPVGSGGLSPDEATGRSNRWLPGASPPSQVDVDRLRQMNKGYADGGRVVKSKLRKNAC